MNEHRPVPAALAVFLALEEGYSRFLLRAGAACLALMTVIALYQITARFILSQPNAWTEVSARALMVWMVFLGLPSVFSRGSLVAFDFLLRCVAAPVRRVVQGFIAAVNLCTLAVILVFGIRITRMVSGQAMAGLEFLDASMAWGYSALPVGAALATPSVFAWLIRAWTEPASADLSGETS